MKARTLTLPGGKSVRQLLPGQTWMFAIPGDWVGNMPPRLPPSGWGFNDQLHIWKDSTRNSWWHAVGSELGYGIMGSGRTMGAAFADLEARIKKHIEEVLKDGQTAQARRS